MRIFIRFIIFITALLIIGRNLPFLPIFSETLPWLPFFAQQGNIAVDNTSLKQKVANYVSNRPGSVSVYFSSVKNNQNFGINEKTVYIGASLNKVPIIATLYHLASKGEIDLDETVTIQANDIQDFGTGSIRYEGAGGVYSLRTLARLSFEKSDNTAAHVLSKKIGMDKIQETIESFGLSQTNMEENKTSVYDMGILFNKIYNGEVASDSLTKEFIGFMDDSLFEDRLPALLPKDVHVYHKIGDEVGLIHDVGIIETSKRAYFIGVMTDDQKDEREAKKTIADISKMVYDAFSGK